MVDLFGVSNKLYFEIKHFNGYCDILSLKYCLVSESNDYLG